MARDRYFKLRSSLKIVDDLDVTEETNKADILWRVRPLFDSVRQGCLSLPKSKKVCINEHIIPLTGSCHRHYVPGKPNPTGLQVFVFALSKGERLDVRAAEVLHMVESVPTGSYLFFNRACIAGKGPSSNWNYNEELSPKAVPAASRQVVAKRGEMSISVSGKKES